MWLNDKNHLKLFCNIRWLRSNLTWIYTTRTKINCTKSNNNIGLWQGRILVIILIISSIFEWFNMWSFLPMVVHPILVHCLIAENLFAASVHSHLSLAPACLSVCVHNMIFIVLYTSLQKEWPHWKRRIAMDNYTNCVIESNIVVILKFTDQTYREV